MLIIIIPLLFLTLNSQNSTHPWWLDFVFFFCFYNFHIPWKLLFIFSQQLRFLLSYSSNVDILISLISVNEIILDPFLASILKFCLYFWDPGWAPMLCMAVLAYLHYLTWVCLGVYCHIYLLNIIYIECTMIHNVCLWVPLLERDNVTNRY